MADDKVQTSQNAKAIKTVLDGNPEATISEISREIDVSEAEVARIIDSHRVEGDKIVEAGVGQGGGWTAPAE